jgi:hypothetical protein
LKELHDLEDGLRKLKHALDEFDPSDESH